MFLHMRAALLLVPSDPVELKKYVYEEFIMKSVYQTWGNISPLYRLDAFDWTMLILYFSILTVLAIYGGYRIKQVVDFWRYRKLAPRPKAFFSEEALPRITV